MRRNKKVTPEVTNTEDGKPLPTNELDKNFDDDVDFHGNPKHLVMGR